MRARGGWGWHVGGRGLSRTGTSPDSEQALAVVTGTLVGEQNSHTATLMRSRDPAAEFSDMAGKALTVEWLVEHAPTIFQPSS